MRVPYRSSSNFAYSFGPGPLTPAIKALVVANVAAYLVSMVVPEITLSFGLRPADVVGAGVSVLTALGLGYVLGVGVGY